MLAKLGVMLRGPEVVLPLRCQKALLLIAFTIVGCTSPSEPGSVSAHFELTDVDGHALPAVSAPSVGTPGQTLVSATLSLDQAGGAILSEDRIDPGGTHFTNTLSYTYTIKGTRITFEETCPDTAICAGPPTGMILDNGLHLQVVFPPGYWFQVYNFRVSATP